MATEKTIKGKRCRYYKDGYIWVSDDGTVVAVKQKNGSWKYLSIKTDGNGEKCVDTGYRIIYVKKAVYVCFCPPVPSDGKSYEICYKDGNKANLYYKNLELKEIVKATVHTTTSTFNLPSGISVTENGGIFYGGQELTIYDSIGDADTDLIRCIPPRVSNPKGSGSFLVDDLMDAAGYIAGEEYSLKSPVILHKDYNPTNFHKDNLEWVEATDPRYIEYQEKVKEWRHQRTIELNPGKPLHPGW